ncbi:MAG TPA: hypothetical protein VFP54_05990 [Acidimicrobiales bacterium]|nr:hypothetical protein [Acidimicrobiales bacterium]
MPDRDGEPGPEYPDLDGGEYTLRFTRRALDDLGCPTDTPAGNVDEVLAVTQHEFIVEKFQDLRGRHPRGTEAPMSNVGRPDIFSLHGNANDRACTWYDEAHRVCWFLSWVPQHRYAEFEARSANQQLLPDADDLAVLYLEAEEIDFDTRVGPGIRRMVRLAADQPEEPVRRKVGTLLNLDVSVTAVQVDGGTLADIFIIVKVPVEGDRPPGWPGNALEVRLAELATSNVSPAMSLDVPTAVPDGPGRMRAVDHAAERAIAIRSYQLDVPG